MSKQTINANDTLNAGRVKINENFTEAYAQAGSYLKYVALLSQSGTDDPVATVLENTLGGTVVWTRNNIGSYLATLNGAFPYAKTLIICKADGNQGGALFSGGGDFGDDNTLTFFNYNFALELEDPNKAITNYIAHIEIRVYP